MRLFEGTPLDVPPHCETCGEPDDDCTCPPPEPERTAPEKQTAKLRIEKRKRGKLVTCVSGLVDEHDHLADVLTLLKTTCGAGGTVREGVIEVQGDHVRTVRETLTKRGYRVKG